jgi:hypothetical protein
MINIYHASTCGSVLNVQDQSSSSKGQALLATEETEEHVSL